MRSISIAVALVPLPLGSIIHRVLGRSVNKQIQAAPRLGQMSQSNPKTEPETETQSDKIISLIDIGTTQRCCIIQFEWIMNELFIQSPDGLDLKDPKAATSSRNQRKQINHKLLSIWSLIQGETRLFKVVQLSQTSFVQKRGHNPSPNLGIIQCVVYTWIEPTLNSNSSTWNPVNWSAGSMSMIYVLVSIELKWIIPSFDNSEQKSENWSKFNPKLFASITNNSNSLPPSPPPMAEMNFGASISVYSH